MGYAGVIEGVRYEKRSEVTSLDAQMAQQILAKCKHNPQKDLSLLESVDKVSFVGRWEAKACLQAIEHLEREGKAPEGYWLLYSRDTLTSHRLWNKSQGDPPTRIASDMPDELGSFTCPTFDLGLGAEYYQMFTHKGESSLLVGCHAGHGYFNYAKCINSLKETVRLFGSEFSMDSPKVEGMYSTKVTLVLRSKVVKNLAFDLIGQGQGHVEIGSGTSRSRLEFAASGGQMLDVWDNETKRIYLGRVAPEKGGFWQF